MIKFTIIYSKKELKEAAKKLLPLLLEHKIMTFTGTLGAGKTSLVKEILAQAGIKGAVSSPTFTYVNIYKNSKELFFHHFDLYRITSPDSFFELGFEELINQKNSHSLIEWPELILPILPQNACHVQIEYHGTEQRKLIVQ